MKTHWQKAGLIGVIAGYACLSSLPAMAHTDSPGEEAFETNCSVCHSRANPLKNKIGPGLFGLVGRQAGTATGFMYSDAMKSAGFTWTPEKLDAYITNPKAIVPNNKMPFPGLADPQKRAALVQYLGSLHN